MPTFSLQSRLGGLALAAALLLSSSSAWAQYVKEDTTAAPTPRPQEQAKHARPNFWDRVNFGGNMGASFGTYTYVELSPVATYAVTDQFMVGPGVTYIYQSVKVGPNQRISSSIYGGRIMSRYLIMENIFAQAEGEALNMEYPHYLDATKTTYEVRRGWAVSPMVGGGVRLPFGKRGGVFLTALYNLNYNPDRTIYPSPFVFRVGISL